MSRTIQIIHLEDSRFDAEIIERELSISSLKFELTWVSNKQDFRKALQTVSPDLILSDHSLPSFSSMEALKMMAEMHISVPFILITGAISEEFAVNILKKGASDYLLKDQMKRLPEAINDCLKKWESRKKEKEDLERLLENKNRLDAMVEHLTQAVMVTDQELRVIYQNATCRKFTSLTNEAGETSLNALLGNDNLKTLKKMMGNLSPGISGKMSLSLQMEPANEVHITQLPGEPPVYMLQFQDL